MALCRTRASDDMPMLRLRCCLLPLVCQQEPLRRQPLLDACRPLMALALKSRALAGSLLWVYSPGPVFVTGPHQPLETDACHVNSAFLSSGIDAIFGCV